jgi:hypothetical protein
MTEANAKVLQIEQKHVEVHNIEELMSGAK